MPTSLPLTVGTDSRHMVGLSMTVGPEFMRVIVGGVVGLLYGCILAIVSIFAAGGGHGTSMPMWQSSAPLGAVGWVAWQGGDTQVAGSVLLFAPPLFWGAIGAFAALPEMLRLTQFLIVLHYVSGLALVAASGAVLADLVRGFWVMVYVAAWATVYFMGQVALWLRIARHNQR